MYGVEADENVRKIAQRYGFNVHIGLFDPNVYEPNFFDYVTMDQVLEHVNDPPNTLHEVNKVLKPGGKFIISVPNLWAWGRYWQADRPDLVIVDFLSPFASVIADELGIPWWTTISSPTFIEVKRGTPAFFGGLEPLNSVWGKCRDAFCRLVVRTFKKSVFRLYHNPIQLLGFKSIYRKDGTERMFSDDVILGLGLPELQFDNVFPKALHWIGPCPDSPVFDHLIPHYESEKNTFSFHWEHKSPGQRSVLKEYFAKRHHSCRNLIFILSLAILN